MSGEKVRALKVRCPFCGALPGAQCRAVAVASVRSATGKRRRIKKPTGVVVGPHRQRAMAARRATRRTKPKKLSEAQLEQGRAIVRGFVGLFVKPWVDALQNSLHNSPTAQLARALRKDIEEPEDLGDIG